MDETSSWIAACGLDCETCPIRLLPFDEEAAERVIGWYQEEGWLEEDEGVSEALERGMCCQGCHGDRDLHWSPDCWILLCCVDEKDLNNCSECEEFPCDRLVDWSQEREAYQKAFAHLQEMHAARS